MNFSKRLAMLRNDIETTLSLVAQKEVINIERDHEEMCFNLPYGAYLCCITPNKLVDNLGYNHNYSTLSLDDLCTLVDYLQKKN